ncbi:MAG: phosphatidylglycerophosphatase A [Bdellovibrio sp.]|nr:MAG: phosphatidylglycerophosphatase A [Bdellovibrio sp.]
MVQLLATWFYLGKSPWAPGTLGTLGAVPLVWLLAQLHPLAYMGWALALCVISVFVATAHELKLGVHDSGEIVIDEVVGFVVAMTWLPFSWVFCLSAFLLFRFLDIWKPFPIGWLDRKIQGGIGVVTDDVAAGIITNMVLQLVYFKTGFL